MEVNHPRKPKFKRFWLFKKLNLPLRFLLKSERHSCRDRRRDRENFYLQVHLPNGHSDQSRYDLKLEARNCFQVSHVGAGIQAWVSLCCPTRHISRELGLKLVSLGDAVTAGGSLTCYAMVQAPKILISYKESLRFYFFLRYWLFLVMLGNWGIIGQHKFRS